MSGCGPNPEVDQRSTEPEDGKTEAVPSPPPDPLAPGHRTMLETESGISSTMIAARGYRTVTVKAELRRHGFGDSQCLTPGLLIPVWDLNEEIANYQFRPDQPRVSERGKAIKYETRRGSVMTLDVPPSTRPKVMNATVPLLVTEGIKKADCAVSHGACCVALLGVWNWKGKDENGASRMLPEFDRIPLTGRTTYLVFDSDIINKPSVAHGVLRLGRALRDSYKADVHVVRVPAVPPYGEERETSSTQSKVGMDDFLGGGGTLDQLLLTSVPLETFELLYPKDAEEAETYVATETGIIWNRRTNEGSVPVPLANFTAVIRSDIVQDDGIEKVRLYELDALLKKQPIRLTVPANQFPGMIWVAEHLGATAIIEPGQGLKERLRVAVQTLSTEVISRTEYAHLGWRQIGGVWCYLHAEGAIGPDGAVSDVVVTLGGNLTRYRLPDPGALIDIVDAVKASLRLFDLFALDVAVALLAVTYLAPLRELLLADPPDFVIWFHGPSGTFKSELAAIALSHYGEFTRLHLPASFAATPNAIERLLSSVKDALLVVDDYHPPADQKEANQMAQVASRLLRGVGNGSGRGRMRADLQLRPEFPPRATVLVTGERLPEGHSNAARMFPVPVTPGSITAANLTLAQQASPSCALAMAGYLRFLAGHIDDLKASLPARYRVLRSQAARSGGHAREPGQVAHLYLALECWLGFAVSIGAMSATQRDERLTSAWEVLLAHAAEHSSALADETPVRRFLALLSDGLAGKRAYLEAPVGGAPEEAERWGWEVRPTTDRDGNDYEDVRHLPTAVLVGVLDDEWLLLFPDATYQFIQAAARTAGSVFPVDLKTLTRRLDEAGLIATEASSGRRVINVWIGSGTKRVIKLVRSAVSPLSPSQEGEYGEWREGDVGLKPESASSRFTATGNEPNHSGNGIDRSGNADAAAQLAIPPIPSIPADREERDGSRSDDEEVTEWSA